jgi:CheY-like chemotaxis protein
MVDPTQFELVMLNLVINARDAMPLGGSVTIETANAHRDMRERPDDPPVGEYVLVTVSDRGSGMTAEVKARAFEPFFTTKAHGSGSGLGLSQVFGTTRQLGGGVTIDSELGRGTVVSLFLPRAAEAATVPDTRSGAAGRYPRDGSGATILLVDDDQPVRTVVAATLRELGYGLLEASSAAAAMEILHKGVSIDVLLTDLVMPGTNGTELAEAAQKIRPDLTIVYISGYAEAADLGLQRRRLIRKPFRPDDLRDQIEAALRERAVPVD